MWLNVDTDHWCMTLPNQAPWSDFIAAITAARAFIQAHDGQTWLLQNPHRETFTVWFMALLCEGKTPLLPSNGQPDTLAQLRPFADQITPQQLPAKHVQSSQLNSPYQLRGKLNDEVVLYTSGSSGTPKAVRKTMRQLVAEVMTLEQTFGETIGQSLIATTVTHQHIYGLIFTVIWPLCTGRSVHHERFEYPEQWHAFHQQIQTPYVLVSSPAQLERFSQVTQLSGFDTSLAAVFSSGGPLHAQIPAYFVQANIAAPIEVFGSTETGGIAWRQRHHPLEPFKLFAGIDVDRKTPEVLRIRSPHLANGDWYQTSDRVEFVDNDTFVMKGRADRTVKLAEKRVSLDDMEAYTERLEWVSKAKCCVLTSANRPQLGLAIELNDIGYERLQQQGKFSLRQALRQHLSQRFEPVVLPRKFRYLNRLPYNDAGKITQAALHQLFAEDTRS